MYTKQLIVHYCTLLYIIVYYCILLYIVGTYPRSRATATRTSRSIGSCYLGCIEDVLMMDKLVLATNQSRDNLIKLKLD